MKTLRVYGDSFASPEYTGTQRVQSGWASILSLFLGIPLSNRAIAGSSTEYSFQLFAEDVINNRIGDTDIIIFVVSQKWKHCLSTKCSPKCNRTSNIRRRRTTASNIYYSSKYHDTYHSANDKYSKNDVFKKRHIIN